MPHGSCCHPEQPPEESKGHSQALKGSSALPSQTFLSSSSSSWPWGRQETSLLSGSCHHFSASHSLPIDFSCLALQLFPISSLCWLVMVSLLEFSAFSTFSIPFLAAEPSFCIRAQQKGSGATLGGDALSEVLPRSCTNSHYQNRLKNTSKQPSDASGEPAG